MSHDDFSATIKKRVNTETERVGSFGEGGGGLERYSSIGVFMNLSVSPCQFRNLETLKQKGPAGMFYSQECSFTKI